MKQNVMHLQSIFSYILLKSKMSAFFIALIFTSISLEAQFWGEYISLFDSKILVESNGLVAITETITVRSMAQQIRHGIFRSIPTRYGTIWSTVETDLQVKHILFDGKSVPFTIENGINGKIIKIGSQDSFIMPGMHTYTIKYTLNRVIGFFRETDKKWAELYLNITGNGWPFLIEKARAEITLPTGIAHKDITFEGYTGYGGGQNGAYRAEIDQKGAIVFETTKPLLPNQGLTVAVTWPRGFVTEPTVLEKMWYFFKDSGWIVWYPIWFLLLILFYIYAYLREKRKLPTDAVIPLFAPPADLSPGAVRYIHTKRFDTKGFAANVVDMAVKGYLDINKQGSWFKSAYQLAKKEHASESGNGLYAGLMNRLFSGNDKITVDGGYNPSVSNAISYLSQNYATHYEHYFNLNAEYHVLGILTGIFIVFIPLLLWNLENNPFFYIAIGLLITIIWIFSQILSMYSVRGAKIANEIEGFKMYLETAETERLKILSTPPDKTPQLYETFLPYAIALGVEEAWSKKFAPVFKQMEAQGHPYMPIWYHGGSLSGFNSVNFSSQLSSQLSSALSKPIASSNQIPGGYSGSGGRGSSGGGAGGGGGGGW